MTGCGTRYGYGYLHYDYNVSKGVEESVYVVSAGVLSIIENERIACLLGWLLACPPVLPVLSCGVRGPGGIGFRSGEPV